MKAKEINLAGLRVLNASRHHRKNRALDRGVYRPRPGCSTPRGITGKIACFVPFNWL